MVPNTVTLEEEDSVFVSSKDIQEFIDDKTEMVSVDEILSSTKDKVDTNTSTTSGTSKTQ